MIVAEINALSGGSTGKIMLNIAQTARQYGIESYTFSSSRASLGCVLLDHMYIDNPIEYRVHMALGMISGYEMNFSFYATRRLIRELERISPDIIHLHNTHGWFLNHSLFYEYLQRNKGIKVVWTLHDCWSFTGRCPYFQMITCDKWITGCFKCPYDKKLYPASYIFDRSKKQWLKKKRLYTSINNVTIVTPSQWLADLVRHSFLNIYPFMVINNGIDLSLYRPTMGDFRRRFGLDGKYILLGVANGWGKRKGLDVFIELSKRLDSSFKIVLVGTNEHTDKELPDNIISIHHTQTQSELAEIYTAADLFVNPTREDNFPTVNLESIACGTPVLTFRTGGSPEMLDSACGSVVRCDDIDALEIEIIRISREHPFTTEACLKCARKYDMDDKFEEYVDLYKMICNNNDYK